MIQAKDFVKQAERKGYSFWTGVPCSFLTPFYNTVLQTKSLRFVAAASEGEAVAIALGSYLGGHKAVVMCQNSGFGNMVNPLTSLNACFEIPALLITSHRGQPGVKDEPQHKVMGEILPRLIETLQIPWREFPSETSQIEDVLSEADDYMDKKKKPFALILRKGTVETFPLDKQPTPPSLGSTKADEKSSPPAIERLKRKEILDLVLGHLTGEELVIGTTGKTGRELFSTGHKPNYLYVVGGMGCASGIALGLALAKPNRKVILFDGDGAALMKMGTLATIGYYQPDNLVHILIDNEAHESTGAQFTVSPVVHFTEVGRACSYKRTFRADSSDSIKSAVQIALKSKGPIMIHIKSKPGSDPKLGRPTLTPVQVKDQFMEWVGH